MICNFKQLIEEAKRIGPKNIIISGGNDFVAINAIKLAKENNLVKKAILVGEKNKIAPLIDSDKTKIFEIVDTAEDEIAVKAAQIAKKEQCLIMKGKITTPSFLHGVLQELRTGRRLSHIAVAESPFYHKLFIITDGGMNIKPNLDIKIDILMNAIDYANKIGIDKPKVAILSSTEFVDPKIPESIDAQKLTDMANEGKFGKCSVAGPLALDLAVSKEAGKIKGIENEVVGDADILLMPDVVTGNITAKAIQYLGGVKIAGIVVGATIPVVMLSRADNEETKINSIALGLFYK